MSETTHKPIPRPPGFDPEIVARVAEAVYRRQLGARDAASMVEKDGDGGAKLHRRAQSLAPLVRDVLHVLSEDAP